MADLTPAQAATLERWRTTLAGDNGPQADYTYIGNPHDAASFYQFRGGVPYLQPCPAELIFNPAANPGPVCGYPANVSLDNNPAPRP